MKAEMVVQAEQSKPKYSITAVTHVTFVSLPMESSLRSRPAKAPPRKAQRTPTKLAKSGPTRERSRNRIDDKIKRRMSMRYAEISSPTQLTGTPAIMGLIPAGQEPDTPLDGDEDTVRDRSSMGEDAKVAIDDKRLLSAEDFDPSKCEFPSFRKFKGEDSIGFF